MPWDRRGNWPTARGTPCRWCPRRLLPPRACSGRDPRAFVRPGAVFHGDRPDEADERDRPRAIEIPRDDSLQLPQFLWVFDYLDPGPQGVVPTSASRGGRGSPESVRRGVESVNLARPRIAASGPLASTVGTLIMCVTAWTGMAPSADERRTEAGIREADWP
jgi:hypothetical protein